MEIANYLSSKLHLNLTHVNAVLRLLSEGSTIPFIARYKKEETGNMSDITLRELEEEKTKFEKLEEKCGKPFVLDLLEKEGVKDNFTDYPLRDAWLIEFREKIIDLLK